MSDKGLEHAELDEKVLSLYSVGGLYELVAQCVEEFERPRCTGEKTGAQPPWKDQVDVP